MTSYTLLREETENLMAWARDVQQQADAPFIAAQQLVRRLGAHYNQGVTEFGFWTPQLEKLNLLDERVMLEIHTPIDDIDLSLPEQQITFQRDRILLTRDGEYVWGVVDGLTAGTRERVGVFYQLIYQDSAGRWHPIHDHLAYSIPFGAFAPAELYDMQSLMDGRKDHAHFETHLDTAPDPDGVKRVQFPTNILQIHARYATETGTIAGLTRTYQRIAHKIEQGAELTPTEQNFVGYDAIQLMPIEPIIEYEGKDDFWQAVERDDTTAEIYMRHPDMTNWGYDVVISASSAINPALLETSRPDELLDLIETLHNFPQKPIKVMLDIVYGHIDNQALPLLNSDYFAGANMYGQNVDFLQATVRAILLEMMRRKHNYGVDGIRVDGAQDFKWWDVERDKMIHDDDFLHLMNDIELDVAGVTYRPWMIFEDGRPWPRDDWELASTYREVTKQMPNVWQWGPLTFAHNTPFLFTFWTSKWWRIREMADIGREWITGCANHDTLRRGSQVPTESRINTHLGQTLPEIIRNAYDNPAAKLFDYAMMPGIPMDFINASMRAPWGFIRNTDDRYSVKVVSEEARWMYWRVDEASFSRDVSFPRLKARGFTDLDQLRRFLDTLDYLVQATHYDLDAMVRLLNAMSPPLREDTFTLDNLKEIARAFMDDAHDYCNVALYEHRLEPARTTYSLTLREFRRQRPWLIDNLRGGEQLDYLHPTEGATIFYGLRLSPDESEQVLFIANMEGAPRTVIPSQLPIANLAQDGWQVAISTPDLDVTGFDSGITFADSQGVIFTRQI